MASSCATGKDWACTQKQLPDLSFPELGLKGAVVPFAVGEAGQTGRVCVHLTTLAASSPKGSTSLESPLGLGSSPVPEQWLAQTPMRSCRPGPQPSPAAPFTPKKVPPGEPCCCGGTRRGRLLPICSASLGAKLQPGTQLAGSAAGDGGRGFTGWLQEPGWKTGGIWRIPSPEDSSSCKLAP